MGDNKDEKIKDKILKVLTNGAADMPKRVLESDTQETKIINLLDGLTKPLRTSILILADEIDKLKKPI